MGAEDKLQGLVEAAKEAIDAVWGFHDVPLRSSHNALQEVAEHAKEKVDIVGLDLDNAGEVD